MAVKPTYKKVELVGGERVPEEHFALSYWLFILCSLYKKRAFQLKFGLL